MKISVSSYSFNKMMLDGKLNQISCIQEAKNIGFDAIEFIDMDPHDGSSQIEYAKKVRAEADRLNMPISSYTVSADFINGSDGNIDAEIESVKAKIDIAEILGAKVVRHDATIGYKQSERGYKGFTDALPILVKGCRAVTEYAKTKGIKTMIENHGFFCQESQRVEMLVNAVANDNFGLLVDMGNFLCADEDPAQAYGRVAAYAFYAHAKDFHVKSAMEPDPGKGFFRTRNGTYLKGAIIGHGNVPVKQCLHILKKNEYDGYVSVEFEGMEENIMALTICHENLRRYIEEA